ncbi:P-II family nitrogen regulator [Pararhodospirillum photometricum]|nr:transcriptional regulator [Pararhodospirillum photometricum]
MEKISFHRRRLVTVITEATLENAILADIDALGPSGYTVTEARGKGSRGIQSGSWGVSSNIRIEIVCDEAVAGKIAAAVHAKYAPHYGMVIYLSDVEVLRADRY